MLAPLWPARASCQLLPGTSRAGRRPEARPTTPGAADSRRRLRSIRAAVANTSSLTHSPSLGEILPRDPRFQNEDDPCQRRPVRHPRASRDLRLTHRQKRLDPNPQPIRKQRFRHDTGLRQPHHKPYLLLGALSLLHWLARRSLRKSTEAAPRALRWSSPSSAAGKDVHGRADWISNT